MRLWWLALLLPALLQAAETQIDEVVAESATKPIPAISIIIDDLGDRQAASFRAVRLPGAVAAAILPLSPYAKELAEVAHSYNKEVILHLPMQPVAERRLGPGGLTLDMTQTQFVEMLSQDIASVPHVAGISNHMGSLLTRHPGHMFWLMQEINRHGDLFFIDSRTSKQSVAPQLAGEHRVPYAQRDVFLDHDPNEATIRTQFERLLRMAERFGSALAIGHPQPETLKVLEAELPLLQERGIRLVSVAELIALQQERSRPWQASLYR